MSRALLLLPLLAACATPQIAPDGPVVAREVTLYRDTLTARMSDGAFCTASREGKAGPWRTMFGGCPHPWPVTVQRPATQPRMPLAPAAQEPWVMLTTPDGPRGFAPTGLGR